jgi:hypothetical protein
MKIIGKTTEGFICTITNNEIRSILSLTDERRKDVEKSIVAGTELTFTTALSNLSVLKDVKVNGNYEDFSYRIKQAKDKLDDIYNSLSAMNKPLIEIQSTIKERQS